MSNTRQERLDAAQKLMDPNWDGRPRFWVLKRAGSSRSYMGPSRTNGNGYHFSPSCTYDNFRDCYRFSSKVSALGFMEEFGERVRAEFKVVRVRGRKRKSTTVWVLQKNDSELFLQRPVINEHGFALFLDSDSSKCIHFKNYVAADEFLRALNEHTQFTFRITTTTVYK